MTIALTPKVYDNYPPWKRVKRSLKPSIILIHATRGPTTNTLQYQATVNWFLSAANKQTVKLADGSEVYFGPITDFVVDNAPGVVAQFGDYRTTRSNWGAGFGVSGTWAMDDVAIGIEFPQSDKLEPYMGGAIENGVKLSAILVLEFDIPVSFLPSVSQIGVPIPRGFTGHEHTANGKKLGKTDPGDKFPWMDFLARIGTLVAAERGEKPGDVIVPPPANDPRFDGLEKRVAELERWYGRLKGTFA